MSYISAGFSKTFIFILQFMEPKTHETTPTGQPSVPTPVVQPASFKQQFLASVGNFLVGENQVYRLEADHTRSLIFLTVFQPWLSFSAVPNLGQQLRDVALSLVNEFGMLIDLSGVAPDQDGVMLAPAIPNRGLILDAGLVKVANVIPYNCEELVHGPHAISINSVRMRPFQNRIQAENWLTAH
jgi:hypothetical protein